MAGEFDDIRQRLEAISEELADLAIQRLRESIDAGGHELPDRREAPDPGPTGRREGGVDPARAGRPRRPTV